MARSEKLVITNPKRGAAASVGRDHWFPYYAGFSSDFAKQLVASSSLARGSTIMDPWNGSGTTTFSAAANGHRAIGFDLNPVMSVVAKARLLPDSEIASVAALLADVLRKAGRAKWHSLPDDPLRIWLAPDSATAVRRIERALYSLLVSEKDHDAAVGAVREMSCLAGFFYVALFRAMHSLLHGFKTSNPTWLRRPLVASSRVRPNAAKVREAFTRGVAEMVSHSVATPTKWAQRADFMLDVASSDSLPVPRESVDLVLSSPPYCTRIDYGVATSVELAVLGFSIDSGLRHLRSALIGTPTVHAETPEPTASWGRTCISSLRRIRNHPSKAARSYYYKTYVQYFAAMSRSFSEVGRCLKLGAKCVLVVQDSYFKDVHIDLASIFAEMATAASLDLSRQVDFPISRTFSSVNSRSRTYRKTSSATESVLCFVRQASV